MQGRRFTTVTCQQCKHTELFKVDSSRLGNVFDFSRSSCARGQPQDSTVTESVNNTGVGWICPESADADSLTRKTTDVPEGA